MNPSDPIFADHPLSPDRAAPVCEQCGAPLTQMLGSEQCVQCLFALAWGEDLDRASNQSSWRFGDFEVARQTDGRPLELGRGAMGLTYRAQDTLLDRPVALKVVRVHMPDSTSHRTRFLHEARRAAALRHPNVASIHQYGVREADGQPFYAMELVEGETLEEWVRRSGPSCAAPALQISLQIAWALQAAEKRGIIHRDLKPANIMLVHGHEGGAGTLVKVIDFGLAQVASAVAGADDKQPSEGRLTGFVGTPAYASPEQLAGEVSLDSRTDFYALGATLWFLLSGRSPHGKLAPEELCRRQFSTPLPFAQLPNASSERKILARLLGRLLNPDRSHRPRNGDELVALVQESLRAIVRQRSRRRRVGWAALLTAVAALLFGIGWHLASSQRGGRHEPAGLPTVTVLPFEHPTQDGEDAFLDSGLQREVANSLATYPGLKVVLSRQVDPHPAGKTNQEAWQNIGTRLGVAYAVAGSVRRENDHGGRRWVEVDLVDTHTGARTRLTTDDHGSADLLTVRDKIAAAVARRLGLSASLPLSAPAASTHVPDPVAYEMYLRAWAETDVTVAESEAQYRRVLRWLHEATTRDPQFARAWAETASWETLIYYRDYDRSPAQIERVRAAADTATRLGADTAESHDAQGVYHYHIRRDYERARQEFAAALRVSPSDHRALFYLGLVERRQGHWQAALEHFRRAETLDPLNVDVARKVAAALAGLHRYNEIDAEIEHWRRQDPHGTVLIADLLWLRSEGAADTKLLHEAADLFSGSSERGAFELTLRYGSALLDRDPAEALQISRQMVEPLVVDIGGQLWPQELLIAQALRLSGDTAAVQPRLLEAKTRLLQAIEANPDPTASQMVLARVEALLGHREEAVRQGRAALDQRPPSRDGFDGPILGGQYAAILALVGDRRGAIDLLQELSTHANGPCYRSLCLDPDWDELRGDPRFEALRLSLAPKP